MSDTEAVVETQEAVMDTAPVLEDPVMMEAAPAMETPYAPDYTQTIQETIRETLAQQTEEPVEERALTKDELKQEILKEIAQEQQQKEQYAGAIQTAMRESTQEYNSYLERMNNSLTKYGVDLQAPENALFTRYVNTVLEKEFVKKQVEVGRPILTRQEMQQVTANHWAQVKENLGEHGINTSIKINTTNLSPAATGTQPNSMGKPQAKDIVQDSLSRIQAGESIGAQQLFQAYNEHRRRTRPV